MFISNEMIHISISQTKLFFPFPLQICACIAVTRHDPKKCLCVLLCMKSFPDSFLNEHCMFLRLPVVTMMESATVLSLLSFLRPKALQLLVSLAASCSALNPSILISQTQTCPFSFTWFPKIWEMSPMLSLGQDRTAQPGWPKYLLPFMKI